MGARGRGSRALRLAWNVNYFILVFTVIGRGHDEPRSLHGEAEAQAVYKAGLRSKGKEVEPDSAGSREELGSLREQSLQVGGGEHGASRPDAPGTLGVMRDELTVYFSRSHVFEKHHLSCYKLDGPQPGQLPVGRLLKEGQEVPGPEPLSIPKAEWGRTPSRRSFAPESENTAVTGAPGPKQLLPERPRAGWCPSSQEGHLPATRGLFLDRRREPPSRSLREPLISGTKPVQGKTGEKPDSSPPSRESVNDRSGCRGRWRGRWGGAGA